MTSDVRLERDALGEVPVPATRLWGAQTERSRHLFTAGGAAFRWPSPVIRAFGLVKQAAALANRELGTLEDEPAVLIARAAADVVAGTLDEEFPLLVFQTGSGTHSNMNANEVIANRANQFVGAPPGTYAPVHPNDHVNRGQSSNDVFPAVMHIALVETLDRELRPSVAALINTFRVKARAFDEVVMIGRTHLQDATPITLGQIIDGWTARLVDGVAALDEARARLLRLPLGGTAVGTGVNAHAEFGARAVRHVADLTGLPFVQAPNLPAALAAHDAVAQASAALRLLAGTLMAIGNDLRLHASGPRTGFGELLLPENEPGSSIMPGKVNPTQIEALTMVAVQVMGLDAAVALANTQGMLQLNVYKPVMLHNALTSARLLADACEAFDRHCVQGLEPHRARIEAHVQASLMLVTALVPHIGYARAAQIARTAHEQGITLREAALASGLVGADEFDAWVNPRAMARPHGTLPGHGG